MCAKRAVSGGRNAITDVHAHEASHHHAELARSRLPETRQAAALAGGGCGAVAPRRIGVGELLACGSVLGGWYRQSRTGPVDQNAGRSSKAAESASGADEEWSRGKQRSPVGPARLRAYLRGHRLVYRSPTRGRSSD